MSAVNKKQALLILGMHRSGTSALAGLCNLLGMPMGEDFEPANKDNELGFWEHREILGIHRDLLKSLNSGWDDLAILPEGWEKNLAVKPYRERIIEVIKRDFGAAAIFAVKEPRLVKLLPLWLDILKELGIEPIFAVTYRAGSEVAASLVTRDWFSEGKAILLWKIYNLEAAVNTGRHKRVFLKFDELLGDWQAAAQKISSCLKIDWPKSYEEAKPAIENFLKPSLRHHKSADALKQPDKETLGIEEIFRRFSMAEFSSEDIAKLADLREELINKLKQNAELNSLLYADIVTYRDEMGKKYTELFDVSYKLGEKTELLELEKKANQKNIDELENQKYKNKDLLADIAHLHNYINVIVNSRSWKITKPLRIGIKILRVFKHIWKPDFYRRLFAMIKNYGLSGFIARMQMRISEDKPGGPLQWFRYYEPTANLLIKFSERKWPENAPKFTVLMCVYNTKSRWLKTAIDSVLQQAYKNFELVLVNDNSPAEHIRPLLDSYAAKDKRVKVLHLKKNLGISGASNQAIKIAGGDYVCLMDHDDYLEPQALYRFAETVLEADPDLIYSDEALTGENIDDIGHVSVRPQFSYDYYLSHPYFVHLVGIRKSILDEIGGFNESFQISQDYDLILRVLEKSQKVAHVPDVLYRWRTHEGSLGHSLVGRVTESSNRALKGHLTRMGYKNAEIKPGRIFNFYDIDLHLEQKHKVAIVIPTKNYGEILQTCVESIEETVEPGLADLFIINHDSDEPETLEYLKSIEHKHKILPYSGPFNFSKIINYGVKKAKEAGGYTHYLILNNDIEATEKGWLEHMLKTAERPGVGIVGAMLLYPTGHIQHAGVIVGVYGIAEHVLKFTKLKSGTEMAIGYNGTIQSIRDWSAVTAACLLIKDETFERISGFDEDLAVGFGDVDLCLRALDKGYKILMDPYAILIHHESLTRGKSEAFHDPHPKDSAMFINRYRKMITLGDPFYSPLHYTEGTQFELRPKYRSPEKVNPRIVKLNLKK